MEQRTISTTTTHTMLGQISNIASGRVSGRVFVTAASFLNITAITGIANLSEISYYEILANEHHHISP